MNKRTARITAVSLLAAALVAVPATGSAFAAGSHVEGSYSHETSAMTEHVSYTDSEHYQYSETTWGPSRYGYSQGYGYGHGLLGLGLIIL
ncbi:hypothetical protein K353_05928 [Kitasatospora sp. SolWspMP-SS2h]|uniref:hypothetical protein n=1 Tax=Kitasatospora sp. SolWspMP-SS2h TaxID=1305729 RepID=UPI000DBA4CA0|nr:hypothetical protein [Kitasatospora sp. SolWspMP-SS2h]RAJ32052.1 hypothetical protein K353_05928 [Kitasatospora sp. SolWspMP-SS2h]